MGDVGVFDGQGQAVHLGARPQFVPIESVIYHHQKGYYDGLSQSNNANDSTVFIEFMLSAILETLQMYSLKNSLNKMSKLMNEKEVIIFNLVSTYLTKNDGITSRQLQDLVGVSAATARRYLVRFVELGLFQPTGQTKSRHYCLASGMILNKNQY